MRNPTRGGFTLIELLVVITVLAILASLVTPMVFRNIGDAKATTARTQMEVFSLALDVLVLGNALDAGKLVGIPLIIAPTAWLMLRHHHPVKTEGFSDEPLETTPNINE